MSSFQVKVPKTSQVVLFSLERGKEMESGTLQSRFVLVKSDLKQLDPFKRLESHLLAIRIDVGIMVALVALVS